MALEGTFREFHVADIMQLIGLHGKTGSLALECGDEAMQILFRDGAAVGVLAEKPPLDPQVASVLAVRGVLAAGKLEEAARLSRETGQPLGGLLTAQGLVSGAEWAAVRSAALEARLYRPFRWTEGRYRFTAQETVDPGDGAVSPLRADALLMEGIRRADEWSLILRDVPSPRMVFKVGGHAGRVSPREIQPADIAMLKLVDGKRSVEELVALSGLGEFEAMGGLASLARANAITAVGPVPAPPAGSAPAPLVRSVRRPAPPARWAPPAWLPRAAWGGALLCLLLTFGLFRWEPLGLVPASSGQRRALDELRSLRARAEMGALVRRIEEHTARQGAPPAGLESLARVGGRVPLRDPWGHPYRLGEAGSRGLVRSAGPDRRADTADDLAAGGA